jgi:23S rRNA (pseudouridine1915-N3)-methyltransferase
MRVRLLCVGRVKDGPERLLIDDYLARARRLAPPLGVRSVDEIEVEAGGGRDREGERLLKARAGEALVRLDERGEAWTSQALAGRLAGWRDAGRSVDFMIGGADGLSPALAGSADAALAFGPQTWPHRLVRAMLAEQVYRALSILAGAPYHRDG